MGRHGFWQHLCVVYKQMLSLVHNDLTSPVRRVLPDESGNDSYQSVMGKPCKVGMHMRVLAVVLLLLCC